MNHTPKRFLALLLVLASVGFSTDPASAQTNPNPEQCCACFKGMKLYAKDSTDTLNLLTKESTDDCFLIPKDKNNRVKLTVIVEPEVTATGCNFATPVVKIKNTETGEVVSIKEGWETEHDFESKDTWRQFDVEVYCKGQTITEEGPCLRECLSCGCKACQENECRTGSCEPHTTASSARIEWPLGTARQGDVLGLKLLFYTDTLSNPGRAGLSIVAPNDSTVTTIRDGGNLITSVKTGNIYVSVADTATSGDANAFTVSHFTDLTGAGTAFRTTLVEYDSAASEIRMTTTYLGHTKITEWKKPNANTWERITGVSATVPNGLQKEEYITGGTATEPTERRKITDVVANEVISDREITFKVFPFGKRKTKLVVDPGGAALTTTWNYYEAGEAGTDSNSYGRVQLYERYDGYQEEHTYAAGSHTIKKPFEDDPDGLVETRTYNDTTSTFTVEQTVGSNLLSKVVEIEDSATQTTRRVYTSTTAYLETVTQVYASTTDFAGQVFKITYPDDTVSIYSYSRPSTTKKVTTIHQGVEGGANITEGTTTVHEVNQSGETTSHKVTAVGTGAGVVLDWMEATSTDQFGRATATGYFPNGSGGYAYTTGATYSCCKPRSQTDKTGITTYYARDELGRYIKKHRLGVTHETVFDGLTTSTHRYTETTPTGGTELSAASSAAAGNEISRQVTNLAGTLNDSWSRSPQTGAMVKMSSASTSVAPTASLSRRTTTTYIQVADDSAAPVQVSESYLDGRTYQSYGDMGPHMRYDYAVAAAGGLTTDRFYVDGATAGVGGTLKETVRTQVDVASRTLTVTKAPGTADVGVTQNGYNSKGQLEWTDDPDSVRTFFEYNAEGERILTIYDLDGNNSKDPAVDRYVRTESNPGSYTPPEATTAVSVISTVTRVYQGGVTYAPTGGTEVSTTHRTPDGLDSWQISPGVTGVAHMNIQITGGGTGNVVTKQTAADGSYTKQTVTGGRNDIDEFFDANDTLISSLDYVTYDSMNRLTHVKDSRHTNSSVTTYYDLNTDVVMSTTDAASHVTSYTYDHRGRRLTVDAPDTDKTHDPADGEYTNVVTTSYFPDGSVKEISGDQTYRRAYTYDYAGRMRTMITYGTHTATTTWNYSANRGWLTSKDDAASEGANYTYTAGGRLRTRTWARGKHTRYTYSNLGQLSDVEYFTNSGETASDPDTKDVTYTYDRLGRLDLVVQGGNEHDFFYDPTDLRLDEEVINYDTTLDQVEVADFTRTINRDWDEGRLERLEVLKAGVSTPELRSRYRYDDAGRLLGLIVLGPPSIPNTQGLDFKYDYEPSSRHLINSWESCYHLHDNTWETNRDVLTNKVTTLKSNSNVYSEHNYVVNEIGQRTDYTQHLSAFGTQGSPEDRHYDYSYNNRGEITNADYSDPTNSMTAITAPDRFFNYDGIGNRISSREGTATSTGGTETTYTRNNLNQYSDINLVSPSYDVDGNATSYPVPEDTTANATLTWDGENRLIKIVRADLEEFEYRYDYLGRRYLKVSSSKTRCFIYDGWNLATQYDVTTSETLEIRFTWGLDLSGSMQGAGGVGALLCLQRMSGSNTGLYYPAYDGNGNITEYLTSSSYSERISYDPFGNELEKAGSIQDVELLPFQFSTKYTDKESGLLYYGYRYYDPETGRWLSRDPIQERGGTNLYGFVYNNPNSWYDILGKQPGPYHAPNWGMPPSGPPSEIDRANDQFNDALGQFATTANPKKLSFGESDPWTQQLMKKAVYDRMRDWIRKKAKESCDSGSSSSLVGQSFPWDDSADDQPFYAPVTDALNYLFGVSLKSLGSNDGNFTITAIDCTKCTVSYDMLVEDAFRWGSATRIPGTDRSFWPGIDNGIAGSAWGIPSGDADNPFGQDHGLFSTIEISWEWDETLSFSGGKK